MTDITDIIQYVKDNACRPISTSDVAKVFSISQGRLSRIFTKQTGETLLTFRDRIRIEKAKQLLAEPGTVAQIALKSGFKCKGQFKKTFNKNTGMTPFDYRKSLFKG